MSTPFRKEPNTNSSIPTNPSNNENIDSRNQAYQDAGININENQTQHKPLDLEQIRNNLIRITNESVQYNFDKEIESKKELIKRPLKEHANFSHDFDDTVFEFKRILLPYLNNHKQFLDTPYFTVTNTISYNEKSHTIELCKRRFYKDLPNIVKSKNQASNNNNVNYCHEKIIIDRNKGLIQLVDDDFKREGVLITKDSVLSKTVKFKNIQSASEILFFQNIYYYKSIVSLSKIYDTLGDVRIKNKSVIGDLKYHDYLKNML